MNEIIYEKLINFMRNQTFIESADNFDDVREVFVSPYESEISHIEIYKKYIHNGLAVLVFLKIYDTYKNSAVRILRRGMFHIWEIFEPELDGYVTPKCVFDSYVPLFYDISLPRTIKTI